MLLTLAAANGNTYSATAHYQMLCLLGEPEEWLDQLLRDYRHSDLPRADMALLDFAVKLGVNGPAISHEDIAGLTAQCCASEIVLDTVLIAAWASFLSCLSTGVGASPDFAPVPIPPGAVFITKAPHAEESAHHAGPYFAASETEPEQFAPFAFFREYFGFVPNVFRAQSRRPDVIAAEAEALRLVLLVEDRLTRIQKERILLTVSAANRNGYFVAVHSEILGALGVSPADVDKLVADYRRADLTKAEVALLDVALKLAEEPSGFGPQDVTRLRSHGFSDEEILEAVVMTSFTSFLNTLQFGLGAIPDFVPRRTFPRISAKVANLLAPKVRPTGDGLVTDADAEAVARVQRGNCDAFEDLINRHSRRVYRTLVGILGNQEEARDAMQDTFLKAFRHLGDFQGRSKFSTWLVSIASNTGLQLLRDRKPLQSLDDDAIDADETFRPRQIRAWSEDPEQLYSKAEMCGLVEDSLMKLPAKYRIVLMLRDIEQLSIEEAATALGLGIPALKSRHLRGRLMLREALTPHFAVGAKGGTA